MLSDVPDSFAEYFPVAQAMETIAPEITRPEQGPLTIFCQQMRSVTGQCPDSRKRAFDLANCFDKTAVMMLEQIFRTPRYSGRAQGDAYGKVKAACTKRLNKIRQILTIYVQASQLGASPSGNGVDDLEKISGKLDRSYRNCVMR